VSTCVPAPSPIAYARVITRRGREVAAADRVQGRARGTRASPSRDDALEVDRQPVARGPRCNCARPRPVRAATSPQRARGCARRSGHRVRVPGGRGRTAARPHGERARGEHVQHYGQRRGVEPRVLAVGAAARHSAQAERAHDGRGTALSAMRPRGEPASSNGSCASDDHAGVELGPRHGAGVIGRRARAALPRRPHVTRVPPRDAEPR
jgi:hypothetical protein